MMYLMVCDCMQAPDLPLQVLDDFAACVAVVPLEDAVEIVVLSERAGVGLDVVGEQKDQV